MRKLIQKILMLVLMVFTYSNIQSQIIKCHSLVFHDVNLFGKIKTKIKKCNDEILFLKNENMVIINSFTNDNKVVSSDIMFIDEIDIVDSIETYFITPSDKSNPNEYITIELLNCLDCKNEYDILIFVNLKRKNGDIIRLKYIGLIWQINQ